MKKAVRISLISGALLLLLGASMPVSALADTANDATSSSESTNASSGQAVQTKALSKPYVVYGSGL
ncbi:MAG TPA: DUF1002 domain-containing protein, partial [Lactobacillus sp.]|nr:DUF1002 domain-containing protein [Lactobacillus sp.]